jgi:APA family basic amino acid/polyamine antiporter
MMGVLVCIGMMVSLDVVTWWRLGIWMAIGFFVFFLYSRRHSRVAQEVDG